MKRLQNAMISRSPAPAGCAAEILETAPLLFRFIRAEMRRHRGGATVPQFRAMLFLDRTPAATVSALAQFLGLSLPTASRLAEGLGRRGFLARKIQPGDRRRAALALLPRGRRALESARRATQRKIAAATAPLAPDDCAAIRAALRRLRDLFQAVAPCPPS